MKKILVLGVSLILILVAQPSRLDGQVPRTVKPALDINWETTKLGNIPSKYNRIISILFSPDGRRVATIAAEREIGGCFLIDGSPETEIYCLWGSSKSRVPHIYGGPIFSPDGRKLAFAAKKDKTVSVVMNGKEGKSYGQIQSLVFSPDSQKLAYVAREGEKRFVVLDEKEGMPYERIEIDGCSDPVFSPDSQKLAFIARKDGKDVVVVRDKDGEKQRQPHDWIVCLTFSPNSQKIVYEAGSGQRWGGGGKQFVVIGDSAGDREGLQYDLIMGPPIVSADSQEVAYEAVDGGKYFVVVGDRVGKKYDRVRDIAFLPGKREVVYVGQRDKREFLVVGEQESKPYERIWLFALSPDGKKVMVVAQEAVKQITAGSWSFGGAFIVLGDKEGKRFTTVAPYREPHGPVFSPDSQTFAYVATQLPGRFFVVVGDSEGQDYDGIQSLVFSPDSKVLAYAAQKKTKQFVVIGTKEGKLFDEVVTDPIFTPDSKKIAYGARLGNELWWIVEDVTK